MSYSISRLLNDITAVRYRVSDRLFTAVQTFRARRRRYPWAPSWCSVRSEAVVHPHVPEERAELFEAFNTGSTEFEVLNWLNATVRLLKPSNILETGAANGLGTFALASACRENGFGTVHSVELSAELCAELEKKLKDAGLERFVEIHCSDSISFLENNRTVFDIGFFDSLCELRAKEFAICLEKNTIRQIAVFHDTSKHRTKTLNTYPSEELHLKYREDLLKYATDERCAGFFENPLSRGLVVLFPKH